jgi:small-conductance mechanosensitive channel
MDDLSKYEALAKKGPWAGYWNLCAAILELVATVRELRKRYETKSNDMAVWKDRAEVAEHEHAIAAKTAEAAEAELDSYMRLHAATANIVLQRAEAAEAENAKLREAQKQADSFAHSAMNARDETRLTQEMNRKLQAELIATRNKVDWLESDNAKLREALSSVVEWWLTEGMNQFNGAPVAIFKVRDALGRVRDDFNLELQSLYNTDHAKLRAMLEINDTLKITKHPTLRRHLLTRIREAIRALGKE